MKFVVLLLLICLLAFGNITRAMIPQDNVKNVVEVTGTTNGKIRRDIVANLQQEQDEDCHCKAEHEHQGSAHCLHKRSEDRSEIPKLEDTQKNKIPSHNKGHRNAHVEDKGHDKKIRYLPEFVVMSRRMSIHK